MIKIAIAIDDWKLPIFERGLKAKGWSYEITDGVTSDTLALIVTVHSVVEVEAFCRKTNAEARKAREEGKL